MKHDKTFDPAAGIPKWRTPEEARKHLADRIDAFVGAAAGPARDGESEAPALALRVTAGVGKTSTTLHALARHADALLEKGHVLVYVPTLDLAERAAVDFAALAPEVPFLVVRGRSAQRPDVPEKRMCEKHEIVAKISGFVPSVTQALCVAKKEDGTLVRASCAAGCSYLRQRETSGARIVFLAHDYLTVRPPLDPCTPVALRIVDEKCWPKLARTDSVYLEDFMQAPTGAFPGTLRDDLARARSAIVDGLQRQEPLHDHLRSTGITPDHLRLLADAERESREVLDVRPWDKANAVASKVQAFDQEGFHASRKRQAIFTLLSKQTDGRCNRLTLSEEGRGNDKRVTIRLHRMRNLPNDAPLLLLDADADPEITARLAPAADFESIDVPPVAEVVQVDDRTLSDAWLLDEEQGTSRRKGVLGILEREVARAAGRGVLVAATRPVLQKLHDDAGQPVDEDDDAGLRQPLLGATPRWFGPKTQGVNDFEDYATVVVIGRLQPHVQAVEEQARCLFGDDMEAISTHHGVLPKQDVLRLLSTGQVTPAACWNHADPRVSAVMRQNRECSTLQVIARLRLASPKHPKRVVVVSNVPLPGFPITRLVPFEALERGLETEPDLSGFLKMEAALKAGDGLAVRGTRLSKAGLIEDLPLDFRSPNQAHDFRRGRPSNAMFALVKRIATANGWPATFVRLRSSTGGHPVPAIVFSEPATAVAQARLLWPTFTASLPGAPGLAVAKKPVRRKKRGSAGSPRAA